MFYVALACRFMTGAVFAVAAIGKLRNAAAYRAFAAWLADLAVLPAPVRRSAPPVVITVEVAITAGAALPWTATASLLLAATTFAIFSVGAAVLVRRGWTEPCQCFGASSTPISLHHVARNALGSAAAAFGAVCAISGGHPDGHPLPVVLSAGCGLGLALMFIFTDDIAALFSVSLNGEARP